MISIDLSQRSEVISFGLYHIPSVYISDHNRKLRPRYFETQVLNVDSDYDSDDELDITSVDLRRQNIVPSTVYSTIPARPYAMYVEENAVNSTQIILTNKLSSLDNNN